MMASTVESSSGLPVPPRTPPTVEEEGEEVSDEQALRLLAAHGGKAGSLTAAQRKRAKQKAKKGQAVSAGEEGGMLVEPTAAANDNHSNGAPSRVVVTPQPQDGVEMNGSSAEAEAVVVEYVVPDLRALVSDTDEVYGEMADVFKHFAARSGMDANLSQEASQGEAAGTGGEAQQEEEEEEGGRPAAAAANGEGVTSLSRKARKRALQMSVTELKQRVERPERVEAHDVTSPDPLLLVHLKCARNTVAVPRHWCAKSKYLARKRGIEKPPFALPDYIVATGITKMRNADLEAADDKSLRAKQRERFLPKMGRIEIDYNVLRDAFFKYQTKPRMTRFGDLYYEGKEFEHDYSDKKPGVLSQRLREALELGEGAPPPWLTKMQQYGPPPSYMHVRFPGVNAPLPVGAQYGTHAGGWGKPPVDQYGRPLYGDVFGTPTQLPSTAPAASATADGSGQGVATGAASLTGRKRPLWGELPERVLDAAEGDGSEAAAATEAQEHDAFAPAPEEAGGPPPPPPPPGGAAPPPPPPPAGGEVAGVQDGTASVASTLISGMETPDVVQLRKGTQAPAMEPYRVLQEKRVGTTTGSLALTSHAYIIPPAGGSGAAGGSGGVEVALQPEELAGLDERKLLEKYEQQVAATEASARAAREDVASVLEEQDRKRKRKEAGLSMAEGSKAKRAKDFKF